MRRGNGRRAMMSITGEWRLATGSRWLGVSGGPNCGPELGFGQAVGEVIDEPILVLKTSQGKSFAWMDFLPQVASSMSLKGKSTDTSNRL